MNWISLNNFRTIIQISCLMKMCTSIYQTEKVHYCNYAEMHDKNISNNGCWECTFICSHATCSAGLRFPEDTQHGCMWCVHAKLWPCWSVFRLDLCLTHLKQTNLFPVVVYFLDKNFLATRLYHLLYAFSPVSVLRLHWRPPVSLCLSQGGTSSSSLLSRTAQ